MNKQYKDFVDKLKEVVGPSNDDGHGLEHLTDVVNHSLDFSYNYVMQKGDNINEISLRLAASLHDIGMKIGRDYHETWGKAILDGKLDLETIIMSSKNTTKSFTKEDREKIVNLEFGKDDGKLKDAFVEAIAAKYKFEAIYNGTKINDFLQNEVGSLSVDSDLKCDIKDALEEIEQKDLVYNPSLKGFSKMFNALFPNILDNGERNNYKKIA